MTTSAEMTSGAGRRTNGAFSARPIHWPAFTGAVLLNLIWINASEVFRYFVFVMPMMRQAFPEVAGVAPMDIGVFLIWGVWDFVLVLAVTGFVWLCFERFGAGASQALIAATSFWIAVFGVLWLGIFNMGLATPEILAVALPLAWLEMVGAALIVRWRYKAA